MLPDIPVRDERLNDIISMAKHWKIPVGYVSEGAGAQTAGMELSIMGPSSERITGDANQDCIVMKASFGRISILMTGDLEKEGEEMFVRRYRGGGVFDRSREGTAVEGDCRILVAGHHGSRYATSTALLDLVKPDLVLCSCCRNNRYGHPAISMLNRLREYGVRWKRTDLEGAASIELK